MIVSWNWLKEYVRLDMSVETLVDRLMMAGSNHESTSEVDGDFAIDLEITSNRPDCLSHLGVAREVSALFGHPVKYPASTLPDAKVAAGEPPNVVLEADAASWCPQYRARIIRGVRVGPSPDWMQRRLRTIGLNPVNNIVDITNYVLFECGQPLHAFDFDKLRGGRIVVRAARDQEPFRAINNRDYVLPKGVGVIADAESAVAVAGIMGGAETEINEQTTSILLESAQFLPLSIRRSSRALDLSSDSSYRFERKIDPAGVAWASERACQLICELAGGTVQGTATQIGEPLLERGTVTLRESRLEQVLGIDVPGHRAVAILESLGCSVTSIGDGSGRQHKVEPPSFRRDLTREIDLVEEVGRIYGYESVPENQPIPLVVAPVTKSDRVVKTIRETLVGAGAFEAVTFSFTDAKTAGLIRPWIDQPLLTVRHSSRKHENGLRQSTLPSLMQSLGLNVARGNGPVSLFEFANLYLPTEAGRATELSVVGLASLLDYRHVRGMVELLFQRLRLRTEFVTREVAGLTPGQAGEWHLNGNRIGVFGLASTAARDAFDLRGEAVVAELQLNPFVEAATLIAVAQPLADQPAVVRDLAVVFDESVAWAKIEQLAWAHAGDLLESLEFVDLYRGKQIDVGKKSIAFRLTFRAPDRTLTREEVDQRQNDILSALGDQAGGVLRT